jgi:hypothetical protein
VTQKTILLTSAACADMLEAKADLEKLRMELDTWRARAFAIFWKLPDDLTLGELQHDAEKPKRF